MSFGFSVGDFIAVAQLARQLYTDIYRIARNAPQEIETLNKDVGELALTVEILVMDIKNPTSILAQSGDHRIESVNNVITETKVTLEELRKLLQKFEFDEDKKSRLGRVWARANFATEKAFIDKMRTKVQQHNARMTLLLTSAGNSSLERIEKSNKESGNSMDTIRGLLENLNITGLLVLSVLEQGPFQITLYQKFMEEAERVRHGLQRVLMNG